MGQNNRHQFYHAKNNNLTSQIKDREQITSSDYMILDLVSPKFAPFTSSYYR